MSLNKIEKIIKLMKEYHLKVMVVEVGREKYRFEASDNYGNNSQQRATNKNEEIAVTATSMGTVCDVAWKKLEGEQKSKVVRKGDVLYTIEFMKESQEIVAEFDMVLLDILFKKGQIVEYGQPLYKVMRKE